MKKVQMYDLNKRKKSKDLGTYSAASEKLPVASHELKIKNQLLLTINQPS